MKKKVWVNIYEWMTLNREIMRCLLGKMLKHWAFWMQLGKLWFWRLQFDRVIKLLSRRDSHPLCLTTIMHTHSSSTGQRHGPDDDQARVNKSMWIDLQSIWTRRDKPSNLKLICAHQILYQAPNWECEQWTSTLVILLLDNKAFGGNLGVRFGLEWDVTLWLRLNG